MNFRSAPCQLAVASSNDGKRGPFDDKGKKGVAEFFRLIYANKDFPGFEVKELTGEGDKVVADATLKGYPGGPGRGEPGRTRMDAP